MTLQQLINALQNLNVGDDAVVLFVHPASGDLYEIEVDDNSHEDDPYQEAVFFAIGNLSNEEV